MPPRRYHVVFNARSGTALTLGLTADALAEAFAAAGLSATIDADDDRSLDDRIAAALAGDADVIVAAGGDGTITALAAAMVGGDKALALLPLGTANLLARDLGVPLTLAEAIGGLAAMPARRIDVGEVNGSVFLHKVVIGTVPGIAAGRERLRNKPGLANTLAFLRYFLRRIARTRRMALSIDTGGPRPVVQRVTSVAVANNAYDEQIASVFARGRLDRGHLTLYVLKRLTLGDVLRLAGGMLVGRWRQHEALHIEAATAVTIETRRPRLMAMIDGEVRGFQTPLVFRIRPGALTVLAPAVAEAGAVSAAVAADLAMVG